MSDDSATKEVSLTNGNKSENVLVAVDMISDPKEPSQIKVETTNINASKDNFEQPIIKSEFEMNSAEQKPVSTQLKLLEEIKSLLEERLSYDTAKEKAIDRLSDEVKFYRDNFLFQSQKPIFIESIMLYDSLDRIINSFHVVQDISKEQVLTMSNNLSNLKEELLEILYRRDVVPFEEHPEFLDYKLHKTVKTVPTSVESENNKIEKVVKIGFRCNDKVLRPEEVIIKKFVKT